MPTLLIIDDEESLLYSLESGLAEEGLTVHTASKGREGIQAVRSHGPDAVILDFRLPDMTGLDVFDRIREIDARLPVIILTAFAATETAIEAVKRGAFEYLLKPVDLHRLREVVRRAFEIRRMQSVPAILDGETVPTNADEIVGRSPPMQAVYRAIGLLAPQDVSVLILGESGTGKELIARALFQHSRRSEKPFQAINCTSFTESLLEAELFGSEKGGTGSQQVGKFEQVNGGTLFLDEIADMTTPAQAKLLRVLEENQFVRAGGNRSLSTDVRVIAATNQDLVALAANGRFRRDLLYRLNGFAITLPPLRERDGDIPILARHFSKLAGHRLGRVVRDISPDTIAILQGHDWPGNVRELQNVIRFAAIQSVGDILMPESLPSVLRGGISQAQPSGDPVNVRRFVDDLLASGSLDIYRRVLSEIDRVVIEHVLDHVKGNQVHASELLGISRTTLRSKLQLLSKDSKIE